MEIRASSLAARIERKSSSTKGSHEKSNVRPLVCLGQENGSLSVKANTGRAGVARPHRPGRHIPLPRDPCRRTRHHRLPVWRIDQ
jgi:hypothetical protein